MVVCSPAPRLRNASGSNGLPNPLSCPGLVVPLDSEGAALAVVQRKRMMSNIPQPMPFLIEMLIILSISWM